MMICKIQVDAFNYTLETIVKFIDKKTNILVGPHCIEQKSWFCTKRA
jgi:hypothetical protein